MAVAAAPWAWGWPAELPRDEEAILVSESKGNGAAEIVVAVSAVAVVG